MTEEKESYICDMCSSEYDGKTPYCSDDCEAEAMAESEEE